MGLMPVFKDGDTPLWGLKDVLVSAGNRTLGLAVEDLAAAECAMRNATRLGIGQRVRW